LKCDPGEGWQDHWADRVKNKKEFQRLKEKMNILYAIKTWKANWIVASCVRTGF